MVKKSHFSHPLQIFLCHSSDDKPIVREPYQRLRADNFNPWLDEEVLLLGQDWHHEVIKAVWDRDVVAVCLSRNSVTKRGRTAAFNPFAEVESPNAAPSMPI